MSEPNVSRPDRPPTETAYRQQCAKVIRCVKAEQDLNNKQLAELLGCSDETISNVEYERTNLNPVTLLKIDYVFGAGTIDPVRELSGTRGVPVGATCDTDALPALTASVHSIAQARCPTSESGSKITHGELAEMVPILRQAIQSLNWMLDRAEKGLAA